MVVVDERDDRLLAAHQPWSGGRCSAATVTSGSSRQMRRTLASAAAAVASLYIADSLSTSRNPDSARSTFRRQATSVRRVEVTAPSTFDPDGPVRLDPRPFRRWSDGPIAALFVVVIVGCVAAAIAWGHAAAVLGAVYSSMALPRVDRGVPQHVGGRSGRAVRPPVGALADVPRRATSRAVDIDPGEPGIDLSIGGSGLHRVVVPLDDWRDRPGAVDRLVEFLTNAERRGARIDPAVWDALQRRRYRSARRAATAAIRRSAKPVGRLARRDALGLGRLQHGERRLADPRRLGAWPARSRTRGARRRPG